MASGIQLIFEDEKTITELAYGPADTYHFQSTALVISHACNLL